MKDFDLINENGNINIECRTDGGIGIYVECSDMTLALTKDEMLKLAGWLITYIEGQKEK